MPKQNHFTAATCWPVDAYFTPTAMWLSMLALCLRVNICTNILCKLASAAYFSQNCYTSCEELIR